MKLSHNKMKKCISSCLFNSKEYLKTYLNIPKTIGILKDHFDVVIYHDSSLTKEMYSELTKYSFVKLIKKEQSVERSGCFWRYEAYNDYDLVFFRDIDVGFQKNDIIVYQIFIKSNFDICWVFLVHQRKQYPKQGFVMGGVFGMKKNDNIKNINILIKEWKLKKGLGYYGSDEEFLSNIIYNLKRPLVFYEPRIKNVILDNNYETYKKLPMNYNESEWRDDFKLSISNVLQSLNNYWHYQNYKNHYNDGYIIWDKRIETFNNIDSCDKLMIVAHPDDEIIFGGYDLFTENNWLVVYCTNDFMRKHMIKSCSKYFNYNGLLLTHADGDIKDIRFHSDLYKKLKSIINEKNWKTIVTHSENGEYGHIQHIQVHKMVSTILYELNNHLCNIRFFKSFGKLSDNFIKKKEYAIRKFYERPPEKYKKLGMDFCKSEISKVNFYNVDDFLC